MKKIKTKNERWFDRILTSTALIFCYGLSLISTVTANEDSDWMATSWGSNFNYQYQDENFVASVGDKLTDTPDTITLQVKNPEPGESWWEKWQTEDYKTMTLTLLDGEQITNDPTDQSMSDAEDKAQELEEQRSSLLNKVGSWIDLDPSSELYKTDDDQLMNQNVIDDVDSEYTIWPDYGIKENLIVKGTNGQATNTFYYQLKLDEGIEYFSTDDGNPFNLPENTYYFVDQKGNYLAHFLPILVYDSNHNLTNQVNLEINPTSDEQILMVKVQVDYAWMIDSDRQYPIIIDPTIVHNTNTDFGNGRAIDRMSLNDNILSNAEMPTATDSSVVGLWHMDEESGTSVNDYSGNNITGTSVNTTVEDGKFGKAKYFNNINTYVQIPASSAFNFGTNDWTFETWIKPSSFEACDTIYSQNNPYTILRFDCERGGSYWEIYNNGVQYDLPAHGMVAGNWYHVAVVRSNNFVYLYQNGNLLSFVSVGSNSTNLSGAIWRIGNSTWNGEYFHGDIDEFVVRNRSLTPEQVKLEAQKKSYGLYDSSVLDLGSDFSKYDKISWEEQGVQTGNGETPYSTEGLVTQWNFNETSGTTAYNNAGSCEGTCNATLSNMTTTSQDAAPNSGWTANNKRWGGGGLMFDGSNDFISISHNSNFNLTSSWTVETWIKRTGPTTTNSDGSIWKFIVRKGTYNTFGLLYDPTSGKVYSNIYNGSAWKNSTSQSVLDIGQWHHIVGVYEGNDSGTLKIFFDGVLENTTTGVGTPSTNTDPLSIIGTSNISSVSTYWPAILDSTRIYSRALAGDEILSNYQAGNIELQTRSGETADPDDGSWENWKPAGSGTETTLDNSDNLYQYNTTDSGLVSYWPMDELTDSSVEDVKGTNNGTATGTKIIDGKFGKARSFNGTTSDYISIPHSADLDFERTSTFSISSWFKSNTTGYESIVSKTDSAYKGWTLFKLANSDPNRPNSVCLILTNVNATSDMFACTPANSISAGNTYHIAMTYAGNSDASGVKIYFNGISQTVTSFRNNLTGSIQNSSPTLIGKHAYAGGNYYLNGWMDELRIYNIVLSSSQVTNQYNEGINALGQTAVQNKSSQNIKAEGTASQKISTGVPLVDANTVALWHLDETGGTGAYIKDSSGNGNNGTPTGTTSVVDGISGKARNFNGTVNDYISIPSSTSLNISSNITIEAWLFRNAAGIQRIVTKTVGNGAANNPYDFGIYTDDKLYFVRASSTTPQSFFSTNTVPVNSWSHVAVTVNNNALSFYVNGIASGTGTFTITPTTNSNPVLIGTRNDGGIFNGKIDEVRVSNIARSADEIAEAYRMGREHRITHLLDTNIDLSNNSKLPFYIAADKPGNYLQTTIGESAFANNEPDTNTVGLWHLEEATGSGAYIKDSSSYSNNGTPAAKTIFDGKIGKAVYGANISMSNEANFRFERTQPFSISGWIKIATLSSGRGYQNIFAKMLGTSPYTGYHLLVADGADSAVTGAGILRFGLINTWTTNTLLIQTNNRVDDSQWHYVVATYDGTSSASGAKIYIDGALVPTTTKYNSLTASIVNSSASPYISTSSYGGVDEVRIDKVVRTADEIRQAYEIGKRTHSVTIDFAAGLDSGNLISNNSDQSFTIDATNKGLSQKGSNLFVGEKVIVRENYDGTEYIAQGLVNSVDVSTGAIDVTSWDSNSTFPSIGFSVNADVFKWQREYWDLTGIMDNQIDSANRLTIRLADGAEGRNVWFDDFKTVGSYLSDPTGSLLNSTSNRYLQYRVMSSTTDTKVAPSLSSVTIKRPPTIDEDNESILAINEGLNRCKITSDPLIKLKNMEPANDPYLVGHWKMNETNGSTVADSSGNGNNGTATGTSIADGVMDKARVFNGSSDFVSIANQVLKQTPNLSFEAWFKQNSTSTYQNIIWATPAGPGSGIALNVDRRVIFQLDLVTGDYRAYQTNTNAYELNTWNHVVGTYSNGIFKIFLNGNEQIISLAGGTGSGDFVGETNYFIGHETSGNYFKGMIDEVSVFNKNLTPEEIKAHAQKRPYGTYTSKVLDLINNPQLNSLTWGELGVQTGSGETPKDATGLVAQWNFNETSGTTATNNAGSCGAACNGTLTNMTTSGQDASVNSGWTANNKKWGAGAAMFDGSDDYINIGSTSNLAVTNFSLETWVKTNTTALSVILGKKSNSTGGWYAYRLATYSGKINVRVQQSATPSFLDLDSNFSQINNNEWHHVVVTFDSDNKVRIYIDGKLDITSSTGNAIYYANQVSDFMIGTDVDGTKRLNGTIDSTKIYSRALSADEILSNYQAGNIELQTRSGATADPNDGSWQEWRPAGSGTETTLVNNENDSSNWSWNSVAAYMPKSKSDDSVVRLNGNTSTKLQTGILQSDANTIALWHLDETGGAGAYIKDSSGNGNDGTPSGTTVIDGIIGKARSFNGTSDYIQKTSVPAQSIYSFDMWFKPQNTITSSSACMTLMQMRTGATGDYFALQTGSCTSSLTNETITIFHDTPGRTGVLNVNISNSWHHITVNWDSSINEYRIYLDGVVQTTNSGTDGKAAFFNDPERIQIGAYMYSGTYSSYFAGLIDEVRISSAARTPEEIAEAYRAGANHHLTRDLTSAQNLSNNNKISFNVAADQPGTYLQTMIGESAFANYEPDANTVGLWHLEEATGSGAYIKDSSNSGNNGTPTGTTFIDGKIGKGRSFNGSSDYISISNNSNLNLLSEDFVIDVWVKPSTVTGTQEIISKRNGAVAEGFVIRRESGVYNFWATSNGSSWDISYGKSLGAASANTWSYLVVTRQGNNFYFYNNGIQTDSLTSSAAIQTNTRNINIGRDGSGQYFSGVIDEVRLKKGAGVTGGQIRQAYEVGKRSHNVTIDFAASLDSDNLIIDSNDKSFTIDATTKGLSYPAENLFSGDKIIVRENYNGTEYIAQGTVNGVDQDSGAVTVSSWDSGSTFPSGGFTVNADVFKWQTEYMDISQIANEDKDAMSQISLRLTNGSGGRNIWLDDFESINNYLTDPTGSAIASTSNQYLQYRAILTSNDTLLTPSFNDISLDYSPQQSSTLSSVSSSAAYLNNLNKNNFPITCQGVTASEPDLTITCQASLNQSNWYDVTSANSPLSNADLTGNVDFAGWTGYPEADGELTIYARTSDGTYASQIVNFVVNKDTVDPAINTINSVAGWTTTPYFDNTDDGNTEIIFETSPDTHSCRWDENDLSFTAMTNTCTAVGDCQIDLTGQGAKTVYISCDDTAGNILHPSQTVNYTIDSIAPTTTPTCSPADNTYFKDNLAVTCVSGEGGDLVRYTSDGTDPTISSDQWFNTNINNTSDLKFISCDLAGNCLTTFSQYHYILDNVAPPAPIINNEPQYTAGTTNAVSSNTVTDTGVGGVQYEFCADNTRSMDINLALNKTATASWTYTTQTPALAVNNNTNDFWGSGGYPPAWIRIDLGSKQNFNQLKLLPQGSPTGTVYYHIQGSDDGNNFTTIMANASANTAGPTWSTHNFSMQSYRYVRIYCNDWANSWVGIREIEIYNTADQPTASCISSGWKDVSNNIFENLLDSTKYYYFVRSKDALNNLSAWSASVNSIQDNVKPEITGINSVAGDSLAPWADKTDDGETIVNFSSSADTADCFWNTDDVAYEEMANLCATTSACTLDQVGEGNHTVFIRCSDIAGNTMDSSLVLNYAIDTIAPTTAPTCIPADNTYFYDQLVAGCTPGFGGTLVRYTNNGNTPGELSTIWENDQTINATTTFKLISCDDANNCFNEHSTYTYNKDTSPPPTPVMTAEPQLSPGTTNTVTSNTVNDTGVGGVNYQFCFSNSDSTENCNSSAWLTTNSYTFTNLAHEVKYYYFVRSKDALNNTSVWSGSTSSTQDNVAPAILSIENIGGDDTSPYLDSTDDGVTVANFISSPDAASCRWATVDADYDLMVHNCSSTGSCTFNLTGPSTKMIYLRCKDTAGNKMNYSTLMMYDVDIIPTINSITYVEDDANAPYFDLTDNGETTIIFGTSNDATACRWDIADREYSQMINNCSSTEECTVNLTGQGAKTVYLRCVDNQNQSTVNAFEVNYTIDSIAPTTAPTCTPESQMFGGSISVNCLAGEGGNIIRYSNDPNDLVDSSSSAWSDRAITTTTNLQLISCDEANNCFLEASQYDYTKDGTPPPTPLMITEPTYTRGTSNTIRSQTVTDGGIGGTIEYQFGWNLTGTAGSGMTVTSDWTTTSEAIFGNLADNTYYYFVRARDVFENTSAWSSPVASIQDNLAATLTEINSVAGDTTPNEWGDNTDDAYTDVIYTADPDVSDCKWSEEDQTYGAMPNTCNSVNRCILNLTGEGEHNIYLRCADKAGNADAVSYNLQYFIDTAPPTAKPTCTATGVIDGYFATSVNVTCSPGTGGDEVRYTTDNTIPTWQSTFWNNRSFNQTTTLKAISCDWANNCFDEVETNVYTQDLVAPPLPVMNAEPAYTAGLTNLVSGTTVTDVLPGVGLVTYQFKMKYYDGSSWAESATAWLDQPEYNFTGLTHGRTYYYAVRARDGLNNLPPDNAWSSEVSSTQDNNYPMVTGVNYVVEDYDLPYVDETDDSNTYIEYTTSDSPVTCRWSDTNESYGDMENTCENTSGCTLTLNNIGDKTVYMRCTDAANNQSPTSYRLDYRVDPNGDGRPPQITTINTVAGDNTSPYFDQTDNSQTLVEYTATTDATTCHWGTVEGTYNDLPNTCTSVSNCNLNLAGNGTKTIYMRCIDGAGNRQRSSRLLVYTIDSLPPTVNLVSVAGDTFAPYYDTSDDNNTVININSNDNLTGVQNCRWDENDQSYGAMANNCENNNQCNFSTYEGESNHTGYIRCTDNIGNAMSSSQTVTFGIDQTEPTVNSIVDVAGDTSTPYYDRSNNTDTVINFNSSDNFSGVADCRWSTTDIGYDNMYSGGEPAYYRNCSTSSCAVGSDYIYNSFWGEGNHTVYLRCIDIAGNRTSTSYPVNLTIDSIPPTVNSIISVENDLTAPYFDYTDNALTEIKYSASDNALGIAGCRWDTNNVNYEVMGQDCDINDATCDINESGQGWHNVFLKCIDLAGNTNSYNTYEYNGNFDETILVPALRANYYIDTSASNIIIDSVNGRTDTQHYDDNTDDGQTVINFHNVTALDSNTAAEDIAECKWDSEDKTYTEMTQVCASTTSCVSNLTGEGNKTIFIRCKDNQDNMTASKQVDYKIDLTQPQITNLISVAGDTTVPYYDTKPDDFYSQDSWHNLSTAIFTTSDNLAGVQTCRWDTSDKNYDTMSNECNSASSCAVNIADQGVHNVYVRCRDWAGNPMSSSLNYEYTYDVQGPTISLNVVENDMTLPYFDYTDNGNTAIDFAVDDNVLGVAGCKWDHNTSNYNLMTYTCANLGLCIFDTMGEEEQTNYISCIDEGGNASSQTVNYWIDTRPPIITSITSVAGDTTANDYNDNTDNRDTLVIFNTLAEDTAECKWSQNNLAYDSMSNVCEGADRCRLNLTGDGEKTVYLRCKDQQNKKAIAPYVLSYNIDTTPPNITSITHVASDYSAPYFDPNMDFITPISFSSYDNVSGIESCQYHMGDAFYKYSCDNNNLCTVREFTGISNRYGSHTAYIKCKDYAQNEMVDYYPVNYTTDYYGPDIDLISIAEDTTAPYYDTSDDGNTVVRIETSDLAGATACRWGINPDPVHLLDYKPNYSQLDNICESTEQCTLYLMGQGTKTIYMRCIDSLGNQTSSNDSENRPFVFNYTIDSSADGTPPRISKINSVAGDTTAVYYDNSDNQDTVISYQVDADTNNCKWDVANLSYDNLANICESTNTCNLNLAGEGAKKVYFKCIDNAGNKTINPYILRYTIDITAPTVLDIVTIASDPNNPYFDNTDDEQTLLLYHASSDTATCKWSTNNQSYAAMPNTCASTEQCNFNLSGWGEKNVFMRCIDHAGNIGLSSYAISYTLDAGADGTPPIIQSIDSVAGDETPTYYDSSDDSNTEVLFTASPDSTQCKWNTLDVPYEQMQNFCESTGQCILNVSGRGAKTVFIKCMDDAGNMAVNSYVLNYIIETMTPRITAVTAVAGDMNYVYVDPTDDGQTLVEYETTEGTTECKWDVLDTNYDNMNNTCQNTERCLLNLIGGGSQKVYMRCKNAANMKSDTSFKLNYEIGQPATDENHSSITAQIKDSIPRHPNTVTVYYNPAFENAVSDGSIKLILSDEFDLSGITKDDVMALGGGVEWVNNEVITAAGEQIARNETLWDKLAKMIAQPQNAQADGENSIIFPYVGDLDGDNSDLQFIIGNANKIINPFTAGTYHVTLEVRDEAGEVIETLEAMIAISEEVNVTASIPSILTFSINPVDSGEAVNNNITNQPTLTSDSVNFGVFQAADDRIAAHDLNVSTNAANGYIVTTQYTGAMTGNAGMMADFIGTNLNPQTWSNPTGLGVESYFGYTTTDFSLSQVPTDRFASNNWAAFSVIPAEVASNNQSVNEEITRIGYRLQITDKQPAGVYNTSVTYICTSIY
ncbi:MAG: LamG-like jellyroll fold domain-containing protein [Patescibacteria group bacterium]